MKYLIWIVLIASLAIGCNSRKKPKVLKDTSDYFPFHSYMQSQVKKLDTSLYTITKIETNGSSRDTTIIRREDVRKYAADFLNLPNLKDQEIGSDYSASTIYDSLLNMVLLTYMADDKDLEVIRMELRVTPTFDGNDQVQSVYIEKNISKRKEFINKKMTWEVDKYFMIRTISQKKNEPEEVHDLKITWADVLTN